MSNKVALISGGTDGVGLSVVRSLIEQAYDVHFIGHDQVKGRQLEDQLRDQAGGQHNAVIRFVPLDLSDLKAVKRFADQFALAQPRLDLMLFSAGVLLPGRQQSADGIEKTLAIGYLSAYLLAHELAPLLELGEHPRIVGISGGAGLVLKPRLDFDDFNNSKFYLGPRAAVRTVHAKVVLMQLLGQELASLGVDTLSVHPGVVRSSLGRNLPAPLNWAHKLAAVFMSRKSKSAIYACTSTELNVVSMQHLEGSKRTPINFKPDYLRRTVEASEALLAQAGVTMGKTGSPETSTDQTMHRTGVESGQPIGS